MFDAGLKVAAAKVKAVQLMPYISRTVFALIPVESAQVPVLGVDKHMRLYYNPVAVEKLSLEELAGAVLHESQHVIRNHQKRFEAIRDRVDEGADALWNVCADAFINADLKSMGVTLPDYMSEVMMGEGDFSDPSFASLTTEQVFWKIYDGDMKEGESSVSGEGELDGDSDSNQSDSDSGGGEKGDTPGDKTSYSSPQQPEPDPDTGKGQQSPPSNCGSSAHGETPPWEEPWDGDPNTGMSESEVQENINQTARDIIDHAMKQPGDMPGNMVREADRVLNPIIPWHKILTNLIGGALSTKSGNRDYSYSKPSRRRGHLPVIFPGMIAAEHPDIWIIIDSSASMSNPDLTRALSELNAVIKRYQGNITVVVLDVEATVYENVTDLTSVTLVGGGGTDMMVGVRMAEEARKPPAAIIILTDGGTRWRKTPPPPRLRKTLYIAGIIAQQYNSNQAALSKVPDWMRAIHIPLR